MYIRFGLLGVSTVFLSFFFFFQAEDGIRDIGVTGVQTCALPISYPTDYLTSGIAYAFHPHRDTWYSAPFCQINWWLPIWDIEERNCLAFHPDYFDKPVENSSEIYNYYEWNAKNRAGAAQHVKSDTREQPKLKQSIDRRDIRILVPPGGMILFSA